MCRSLQGVKVEDSIARTIQSISNWDDLRQFEVNARARDRLTDEITDAIKVRAAELGRALIAEKTGLDMTELSPAESKIVQAVSEYVAVMRQQGKYPQRTFDQLRNRGLIDAAESAVCRAKPTQGFQVLVDADLEDLSYEQIVVDHPDEFSPRALWFSRRTLGLENQSDSAPASTHSDTQTRTTTLVQWLWAEAEGNGGVIPAFTNADAAGVMGIGDMQRYGQVHGNIQSRIDFACFMSDLPPLGLAADAPFAKAWSQQDRDWAFPVDAMQAAAQSKVWSADDFNNVLRESERLPGQAHLSWKEALVTRQSKVKAWALGFLVGSSDAQPRTSQEQPAKRNPAWTRDELILALDLYLRHRASPPGKDSDEVAELSEFLNRIGQALGQGESETYRNTNGVYMKMMNFRRFDPEYTNEGKVGLTRGNKDEEVVWNEFASDAARLSAVVSAIRRAIETQGDFNELGGVDEPDIQEAEEGRVLTRVHRVRERSRKLVDAAKTAAIKKHGRLVCETCNFDFSKKYGSAGDGLIDVHHTKPVHTLVDGETTKLQDLALLCANCHRVVHSSRRWLTLEQVRLAIQGQ